VPLIQALTRIDGAPRTSIFDFFYNPAQGTNGSITCFVPRIPQIFSKEGVQFYDNQIPEASNVVVNIYYEVNSSIPEELLNRTLTKDGLTIQQVLSSLFNNSGDEDNADAKWSASFHSAVIDQLRSGFNFNNTNLFAAINETLEAFNAIAIPDTINKIFYIYDKDTAGVIVQPNTTPPVVLSRYKQDTGLSLEYGKYLRGVSQSISSDDIVTVIRGLGEDNITAASATPTGFNEWEDYTYYLDGAQIVNYEDLITQSNVQPKLLKSSRWMSNRLTIRLLLWMKARETAEDQLYQRMPSGDFTHPTVINVETGTVEQQAVINPFTTFSLPQLAVQKRILSASYIIESPSNINDITSFLEVDDTFAIRNSSSGN
jgi:hypothetical protein